MFRNCRYVNSTAITFIAYAPSTQTLRIVFRSGSVYDFTNVPASVYRELSLAQSVGTHFTRHVRNNRAYTSRRLPPQESAQFLLNLTEQLQAQALQLN